MFFQVLHQLMKTLVKTDLRIIKLREIIIKENESFPYQMVSGHIPGTLEEDEGKNIVAVGRYKYKDSYEKDGKRYVTIENEQLSVQIN